MNTHKLTKLAIGAVIAVVAALWIGNARRPSETLDHAGALLPGLKEHINEVKTLRITGAENKPIVTLARGEGGWSVNEKNGYPADVSKVREFLLKLSEAELAETKTATPELYTKLGVEDIAGKDAKGALVEIEGTPTPGKVIVGNFNGQGGDGTFVRRPDEAQSYLVRGNLTVDKTAANWLLRDLADIASSRIAEVRIEHAGKTLRAFKTEGSEANYAVADVPKGRELSSEFVANGLASVLSGLRFDDVMPAASAQPADGAKVFAATYVGFDGLTVDAKTWEQDGKDYAIFNASLDEARLAKHIDEEQARARADYEAAKLKAAEAAAPADAAKPPATDTAKPEATTPAAEAPPATTPPEEPLAVKDPAKDREIRLEALRKEVNDLNARFAGWTFVIPAYKYANINKTLDDMLKPLDAAKPKAK